MKHKRLWALSSLLCLVLVILLACAPGTAPTPTPTTKPTASPAPTTPTATAAPVSYAGKTVTIVLGSAAGSAADATARIYAQYLSKYLPGNPTVIVRDMPGGNATIAGNYVYGSKPDGLTTLICTGSVLLAYTTRMSAAKYDLQKMEPLVATSESVIYYIKPGIISKAEDLPKASGLIFGYSTGSYGWMFVALKNLMDIHPDKVVLSYSGSSEARRAFLSGEINMTADAGLELNLSLKPYVEKGDIQVLFQGGTIDQKGDLVRHSSQRDIPTAKEIYEKIYGKPPSDISWEAYKGVLATALAYTKVLVLSPGIPDNILNVWRTAIREMVKDPEFRKVTDTLWGGGVGVTWMLSEDFGKQFKTNLTMDPKVLDWLKTALGQYNVVIE